MAAAETYAKGAAGPGAVRQAGRRLRRLKRQAARGQGVLLFEDESEALTYPYLGHAWAPAGTDLRVPAPGRVEKMRHAGGAKCN